MDNKQAREFFGDHLLSLWNTWAEKVTPFEMTLWAKTLEPYSWEACKAGLEKYFNSEDYTIRKPKPYAFVKYIKKSSKGSQERELDFAYIQNTVTGVFYSLRFSAKDDVDRVLAYWFKKHHNDGEWKAYTKDQITFGELLKYQLGRISPDRIN